MSLRGASRWLLMLTGVMVLSCHAPVHAWDWRDAPIGLRIGLAFDRQSTAFTDVVGLSASSAYPYGSSVNPANDDFIRVPPNEFTLAGTATGVYIPFAGGASLTATAGSLSARLPRAGTLTASYSQTESNHARSAQGDSFDLLSDDITIGYSQQIAPWLAVGGEFRLSEGSLDFGSSVMDFPLHTRTTSTAYDVRMGALAAAGKDWVFALMGGAAWSYAHTRGAVEIPPAFGGPVPIEFDTLTRTITVRAGAGWRPSESFGAYTDLQYVTLYTDEDSAFVGRVLTGIEYLPIPALALRVGASVDSVGKTNVSAGVGFYGLKHAVFEIAYVYNPFPEVRREFGVGHLFSVSGGFYF